MEVYLHIMKQKVIPFNMSCMFNLKDIEMYQNYLFSFKKKLNTRDVCCYNYFIIFLFKVYIFLLEYGNIFI